MSELYLTATALKDYLDCPQKFKYRLDGKESIQNIYFWRGLIVHDIIANQEIKTSEEAKNILLSELSILCSNNDIEFPNKTTFLSILRESNVMLDNYYNLFNKTEPPITHIELEFSVVIDDIKFVGRIDQIRGENLYDWKTKTKPVDNVTLVADYQFTLYGIVYKQLFGKYPKNIFYGHLYSGTLYPIKRTRKDYNYLLSICKDIKSAINMKLFPRSYGEYKCNFCQYRHLCFNEDGSIRY